MHPRSRTPHATRRRLRGPVSGKRFGTEPIAPRSGETNGQRLPLRRTVDLSDAAVRALRVFGDERTDHVSRSLVTDRGEDLLAAGVLGAEHLRFLFFCAAVLDATPRPVPLVPRLELALSGLARGERCALDLAGAWFRRPPQLADEAIAASLSVMTTAVLDWRAAGDRLEPAVREVVADAYRRHRAAALSF